jgi:hypothetical protein
VIPGKAFYRLPPPRFRVQFGRLFFLASIYHRVLALLGLAFRFKLSDALLHPFGFHLKLFQILFQPGNNLFAGYKMAL